MRAVVQRVSSARVTVDDEPVGAIGSGFVILLGVGKGDNTAAATYLAEKVANLRVMPDEDGHMNRSLLDVGGAALVISQFTLFGDVRRGRRPAFDAAAPPEAARWLYEFFCVELQRQGVSVATGRFQAHMRVELVNDGPVTVLLDSAKTF